MNIKMCLPTLGLIAALLLMGPARADLIIFIDGLSLKGKVIRISERHVVVSVENGGQPGVMTIPRRRVRIIEYDIESRRKAIEKDDFRGLFRLGKWAFENGLYEGALEILLPLVGKKDEGVPLEIHRILLRIYESQDDLESAAEQLVELIRAQPKDKALMDKLKNYRRKLGLKPGEGPGQEFFSAPAKQGGKQARATATKTGARQVKVKEGLETQKWTVQNWGNRAKVSTHQGADGNRMLSIEVPSGGKEDKTVVATVLRIDLTDKKAITLNIFNAHKSRPTYIALAIDTQADYFESKHAELKPNTWNMGVSFDLTSKRWKSKKSGWKFTTRVLRPETTKRINLLIYDKGREVKLFVDDIRAE